MEFINQEGQIAYSDLFKRLKLSTTGKLNFHLKALKSLLKKSDDGYQLNAKGRTLLQIYELNEKIFAGEVSMKELAGSAAVEQRTGIHRIGVILCTCRGDLCNCIGGRGVEGGATETLKRLKRRVSKFEGVVSVKTFDHLCQVRSQKVIDDWIQHNYINRVVVAACSYHLHEHLFSELFRGASDFALSNVEFVNLREQVCWVNSKDQPGDGRLMKKMELLIKAAVERCALQGDIQRREFTIEKSVAILGGGIAGINLAKNLASAGIPKIYLVDSAPTLGGKVIRWSNIAGLNDCCACILSEEMVDLATAGDHIEILAHAQVKDITGFMGNYQLDLEVKRRFVDTTKCHACQACAIRCQELDHMRPNEFEFNLTQRPVIDFPFSHAFPYLPFINRENLAECLACKECVKVCKDHAIDFSAAPFLRSIRVGAVVFAIGAEINSVYPEYHLAGGENVLTAAQFERLLSVDGPTGGEILKRDGTPPESVAIIQCAGPMDHCNQFCCQTARKYSDAIKTQRGKDVTITIYYDVTRLPPVREHEPYNVTGAESLSAFYSNLRYLVEKAEEGEEVTELKPTANDGIPTGLPVHHEEGKQVKNLKVVPLDPHAPKHGYRTTPTCVATAGLERPWAPKFDESGQVFSRQKLRYEIQYSQNQPAFTREDSADLVILNNGFRPNPDIQRFKQILDFNLTSDGYIYPDSLPSGVFAVGAVTGPKGYRDVLNETNEVFVRLLRFLNSPFTTESQAIVEVRTEGCSKCGICVGTCPYSALKWRTVEGEEKLTLDLLSCKGCGLCVVSCPTKAIEHPYFSTDKILKTIDILAEFPGKPKAIAFCCKSCGYAASDEAGRSRIQYHTNVFIVPVPCMGRLDANFILHAFVRGFDVVFCIGCHEGNCRYITGVSSLKERIELLKSTFPGLANRIVHVQVSAVEGQKFANRINTTMERARAALIPTTGGSK